MRAVIARGVFNPYHEEKKGFDIVIQVLPNATCVHSLTRQGRIALEKIRRGERDVFSFFPKVWLMLSFAEDQAITFLHVNIPGMKIVCEIADQVPEGYKWPAFFCLKCKERCDHKACRRAYLTQFCKQRKTASQ